MSKARELDDAKDRLVDSLTIARDATKTAVVEEIAPAVVAAVEAARLASGPMYAEAASRAADAVSALRSSEAAARAAEATARATEAAKVVLASEAAARAKETAKDTAKAAAAFGKTDTAHSLRKQRRKAAKALAGSEVISRALRRESKNAAAGRKRWTFAALAATAGVVTGMIVKRRSGSAAASYPAPVTIPPAAPAPSETPTAPSSVDLTVDESAGDAPTK